MQGVTEGLDYTAKQQIAQFF